MNDFNQEEIWEKINRAAEKNGRTITKKRGYVSFYVALNFPIYIFINLIQKVNYHNHRLFEKNCLSCFLIL